MEQDNQVKQNEVEQRMQAGLLKALHTPAKPHVPSKEHRKESQSK
jgi:hypothetical protein